MESVCLTIWFKGKCTRAKTEVKILFSMLNSLRSTCKPFLSDFWLPHSQSLDSAHATLFNMLITSCVCLKIKNCSFIVYWGLGRGWTGLEDTESNIFRFKLHCP